MGRKCFAGALLFVLILSCCLTCFGAKGYTITIHSLTDGHHYEAYQIFAGKMSDGVLYKTVWGDGIDAEGLLSELQTIEDFQDCRTAVEVAEVLSHYGDDSEKLREFAALCEGYLTQCREFSYVGANDYVISVPEEGYYLIKDRDDSLSGTNDSYTRIILTMIEDQVIYAKMGIPTLEKTVWNENKTGGAGWDAYTVQEIGQTVTFRGIGTLPENLKDYESYRYTFTDTLPEGLSFVPDSVKLTLNQENGTDLSQQFTIAEEEGILTVSCSDIRQIPDLKETDQIILTYQARLNSNAVVGNPGNANSIQLTFSNDPNWDGEGECPTGSTPPDRAVVFTFALELHKVDMGTQLPVAGAEFLLSREDGAYLWIDPQGAVLWTQNKEEATNLATDPQGLITVQGIVPGTYYLTETKAPNGYNMLEAPVKVELSAQYGNGAEGLPEVTELTAQADGGEILHSSSSDLGGVEVKIENAYGTVLPSTGGAGTTVYYLIGMILLSAVTLVLVAKRLIREQ